MAHPPTLLERAVRAGGFAFVTMEPYGGRPSEDRAYLLFRDEEPALTDLGARIVDAVKRHEKECESPPPATTHGVEVVDEPMSVARATASLVHKLRRREATDVGPVEVMRVSNRLAGDVQPSGFRVRRSGTIPTAHGRVSITAVLAGA